MPKTEASIRTTRVDIMEVKTLNHGRDVNFEMSRYIDGVYIYRRVITASVDEFRAMVEIIEQNLKGENNG
jgi:hypothetical protein